MGHQVAWFIPKGDEAEKFIEPEETRLMTIAAVLAYSPHAVLTSGNMIPHFFPGIKVQLFHGIDSGKTGEADIRGFYDLYCTQSPAKTEPFVALKKKYNTFDYVETGWSKMDPLFFPHPDTQKFKKKEGLILYAPTFSKSMTSTGILFEEIKRISRTHPWNWVVKFHPKASPQDIDRYASLENERFKVVETGDSTPLLQAADVMLSDTSSIVTEFALLKKPVVTFRNLNPRAWMLQVSHPQELEANLTLGFSPASALMDKLRAYAMEIHPFQDGRSSLRVVDAVENMIASGTRHLAPKPMNLIRKFKMRKKLKYWSRLQK